MTEKVCMPPYHEGEIFLNNTGSSQLLMRHEKSKHAFDLLKVFQRSPWAFVRLWIEPRQKQRRFQEKLSQEKKHKAYIQHRICSHCNLSWHTFSVPQRPGVTGLVDDRALGARLRPSLRYILLAVIFFSVSILKLCGSADDGIPIYRDLYDTLCILTVNE